MKKTGNIFNLLLLLGILIFINVIGNQFYTYIDLTEDKRYTLTDSSVKLLDDIDDNYFISIYLDGTFPASLKRYRNRVEEVIREFKGESSYINFEFIDPLVGTPDEKKLMQKKLVDSGLYPRTINYFDGEENIMKPIYPYAIFKYGGKQLMVNLLDVEGVSNYDDATLNAAEGLLEYKFSDAIYKLKQKKRKVVAFTTGNGELRENQIAALQTELSKFYNPQVINLDSVYTLTNVIDVLIVAGPRTQVSPRNQFLLDQYIMNGGKIIWLIESMNVRIDSIALTKGYVPRLNETGLNNIFFKYGFKILDNAIQDLECSKIPQVVGNVGGKTQMEMFKYYFHPLISSTGKHPIVKNIDRVNMFFPSTIDTVITSPSIRKEFLLRSSQYSKYQLAPLNLNFRMLGVKPQPSKFNRGNQPVALLLEGEFESAFKNRLSQAQMDALSDVGGKFVDNSVETAMIVVSDAEFIKNLYNPKSQQISPIGFNKWEQNIYKGNREFIINCIEYLLDENGILESRAKEYKLRLLDEVEVQDRKVFWQSLNIAFPLAVLLFFGIGFYFVRKWKYSR